MKNRGIKATVAAVISAVACATCLVGCDEDGTVSHFGGKHVHSYSEEWKNNEGYHWHECSVSGTCDARVIEIAPHDFDGNTCSVCNYINSNPDRPDNPDNPDNPEKPDNPDNPENPDNPDTPSIPDRPYKDGRIVMYATVPETGTPEDHDLISNVKYAAQKLYTSPYFRGETTGKIEAELGLGIKYTQNVHNVRVVKNGKIFSESISSSTMKSVAEQKYFCSGTILKRAATSVSGSTAVFEDSVTDITDTYYDNYGILPNELTKQCISDIKTEDYGITILSVRDDNAKTKSAENNNGEQAAETDAPTLDIDVPQSLVRDSNGHYTVTLVLDPIESTKYSRSEVRTLAGTAKNPVYQSVRVTITIDDEWNPISITTVERYDIEESGIGAMTCTSTLTEKFSDIGNTDGVLPEEEFFEAFIDGRRYR